MDAERVGGKGWGCETKLGFLPEKNNYYFSRWIRKGIYTRRNYLYDTYLFIFTPFVVLTSGFTQRNLHAPMSSNLSIQVSSPSQLGSFEAKFFEAESADADRQLKCAIPRNAPSCCASTAKAPTIAVRPPMASCICTRI